MQYLISLSDETREKAYAMEKILGIGIDQVVTEAVNLFYETDHPLSETNMKEFRKRKIRDEKKANELREVRKRDSENEEENRWRETHVKFILKLNMPNRLRNCIARNTLYRIYVIDGVGITPEEWVDEVLHSFEVYKEEGLIYYPLEGVRNLGSKGYSQLIQALQEWKNNHDSLRTDR